VSYLYFQYKSKVDLGKLTSMRVLLRADVVQLDDVAALEAALNGALTGDLGSNQYAILRTMPKKSVLFRTVSQLTWWESAG
jgi:hypothetical protein